MPIFPIYHWISLRGADQFLRLLHGGHEKHSAYVKLQSKMPEWTDEIGLDRNVLKPLQRLLEADIGSLDEDSIDSSGYVISTLEASIWCLLTTSSVREALLTAVNLGNDTDSVACVCGSLCGLVYGVEALPEEWLLELAQRENIENLAERMAARLGNVV